MRRRILFMMVRLVYFGDSLGHQVMDSLYILAYKQPHCDVL
jgi:hypothetical protein